MENHSADVQDGSTTTKKLVRLSYDMYSCSKQLTTVTKEHRYEIVQMHLIEIRVLDTQAKKLTQLKQLDRLQLIPV